MEAVLFAVGTIMPLLLLLVVVHEFGHYITAKMFKVKTLEFGVGFAPRLFAFHTGKTVVNINANTNFIGLDNLQSIKVGQKIKIGSIYDAQLGLVAFEIEGKHKRAKDAPPKHYGRQMDHVLWHEGIVKSVGDDKLVVADMVYSLNLIPLGGFVKLAGETNHTVPYSLAAIAPWKRIIVMAAGGVMNLILPAFMVVIMFMIPTEITTGKVVVSGVLENSSAATAGITPGSVIISANKEPVDRIADIVVITNKSGSSDMELVLENNNGTQETVTVVPQYNKDQDRYVIGVSTELKDTHTEKVSYPIWEAVPRAVNASKDTGMVIKSAVEGMVSNADAPEVAGPIGIAQMTGEVTKRSGLVGWMVIGMIISINLGVLNLLPIPMLDGGRIAFVVLEWVRGKRIPHRTENAIHAVGLALLLGLILIVSANDVMRILN